VLCASPRVLLYLNFWTTWLTNCHATSPYNYAIRAHPAPLRLKFSVSENKMAQVRQEQHCCHLIPSSEMAYKTWAFLSKIFSVRQPCQGVKVLQSFGDWLFSNLQGVTNGLVTPNPITSCPTVCCVSAFWLYQATATPWRWGSSQSLKRWPNFTPWRRCLRESILLNSVAAKASRIIWNISHGNNSVNCKITRWRL
jgi:hypothetical protein